MIWEEPVKESAIVLSVQSSRRRLRTQRMITHDLMRGREPNTSIGEMVRCNRPPVGSTNTTGVAGPMVVGEWECEWECRLKSSGEMRLGVNFLWIFQVLAPVSNFQ